MSISVREAATRLGITRQAVHQLIKSGALQGERQDIAGVIVWTVDEGSVADRKEVGHPKVA